MPMLSAAEFPPASAKVRHNGPLAGVPLPKAGSGPLSGPHSLWFKIKNLALVCINT